MIDAVIKLAWNYTVFRALFEKNEADCEARQAHPGFFLTMHPSGAAFTPLQRPN